MACISITSPGKPPAQLQPGWGALYRIAFFDVWPGRFEGQPLFSQAQARELLDFIEAMPPHIEHLVVHCHAGVSRSAAVARLVARNHKLPFPAQCHTFNPWVYERLDAEATSRASAANLKQKRMR